MTPTVRKATPLKRVGRDASLHPATVQKVAAAKVVPFRQDRTRPRPPAAHVTSRTVDPRGVEDRTAPRRRRRAPDPGAGLFGGAGGEPPAEVIHTTPGVSNARITHGIVWGMTTKTVCKPDPDKECTL